MPRQAEHAGADAAVQLAGRWTRACHHRQWACCGLSSSHKTCDWHILALECAWALLSPPVTSFLTMTAQASGSGRPVQFAVVLWGEPSDKCRSLLDCQVLSFADVLSKVG